MPSPFPGIDPFVENRSWQGFHLLLLSTFVEMLVPSVRPRYTVELEERIYLEHQTDENTWIQPGVTILDDGSVPIASRGRSGAAIAAPMTITLPIPEEVKERWLTIRQRETQDVVTVIELLSPSNKRVRSDGRAHYMEKREAVLRSRTHLVELDFLRRGERLPTSKPLPQADYFAVVSRRKKRPHAELYYWTVRDPLPEIPIPLSEGDPDCTLNLQVAFASAFDRAGYDYSLRHEFPLDPPLSPEDESWARSYWLTVNPHDRVLRS